MALKVEHEMHRRRRSRNVGLGLVLVALIGVVFGLSVVKITTGESMEGYDHALRPQLVEDDR
ncbi:hypothetical protein [Roseitranquillus sediminis]|uniref:hypothetical protein n=1 Tax=Roseitranquillus sediminis TaxID=2809051 RepID=UPI001D0C26B4|nr:hypothetical protein [Roseitranquillus sediminis]MBM9593747.1 hypothetical protein [Roseitranquillus sediminis]